VPVRKTTTRQESREVDPLSVFHWSATGLDHPLGEAHYQTAAEARRAWERNRRALWARAHRFQLPGPAKVYDRLTLEGRDFVLWSWNHVPPFDLPGCLEVIASDRANLEAFRQTRGARSIADYLDLFAADIDMVEHTARDLATYPAGTWRPYPVHLNVSSQYGTASTDHHTDDESEA
jgi:hypothetical protein